MSIILPSELRKPARVHILDEELVAMEKANTAIDRNAVPRCPKPSPGLLNCSIQTAGNTFVQDGHIRVTNHMPWRYLMDKYLAKVTKND